AFSGANGMKSNFGGRNGGGHPFYAGGWNGGLGGNYPIFSYPYPYVCATESNGVKFCGSGEMDLAV
ncbi:MAG TPA: hypothetical protein VN026_13570, partial [Bacteroidia bacterium]|nr:hypothetical protein [Bacteroidia bacterium]